MKSPWLSMWLSAANSAAGTALGFWTAEMRRHQKAMMNEAGRPFAVDRAHPASKKRTAAKRKKVSR